MFFYCSIDSIYKMFVYKVLWIFTVKCLQLFNKELYVYFVQAPFCESFRKQILNYYYYYYLKRLKTLPAGRLQAPC